MSLNANRYQNAPRNNTPSPLPLCSSLADARAMLGVLSRPYTRLLDLSQACDVLDGLELIRDSIPPSEKKDFEILWSKAWRIAHARKRSII